MSFAKVVLMLRSYRSLSDHEGDVPGRNSVAACVAKSQVAFVALRLLVCASQQNIGAHESVIDDIIARVNHSANTGTTCQSCDDTLSPFWWDAAPLSRFPAIRIFRIVSIRIFILPNTKLFSPI